jgi:signal transduction histidine kinase
LRRQIIHPDDHQGFQEHHQTVHNETVGTSRIEYRIIARDGTERWVDHICRPIFDKDDRYLGRRVSNRDITNRKLAEQEIQKRNERENMLVQTIHTMQMDIARDLHDTIGQNVSYLRMKLDHLSEKRPQTQTEMDAEIKNMFGAASETYDLMRGTLALLNSENSTDLLELFRRYAEQISVRSTFEIDFAHYGKPRTLTANQMRHLFYVFREALSNIEKYANASQVSMEITWDDDYLVFVIFDNGLGFDTNQLESTGHYGIQSMQKRAAQLNGSLQIYSIPGSGTNIVLRMPY